MSGNADTDNQTETVVAVTLPIAVSGYSSTPWQSANIPVERLAAPKPQVFENLSYYDAYMLATLPRKRADDPASTPLACTLTAAIPALISFAQAFSLSPFGFSLGLAGLLEIALFVGCAVWFVVTKAREADQKTSLAYLADLKSGRVAAVTGGAMEKRIRWWQFWRRA